MNFYCYKGNGLLGSEPCGCEGKFIWHDLKTTRGAIRRANRFFGPGVDYRIYSFSNFYDDSTFKRVV